MSKRTDISQKNEFFVAEPADEQFLFAMDPGEPRHTTMTIPRGSKWHPKPHWHERYDEFFLVKKGRALYSVDGVDTIITAADGLQTVKIGQIHDFMRADKGARGEGTDVDDLVVEEWTEPEDGLKQVFFRNLLGVIEDKDRYWGMYTPIQALLVMSKYDNYPQIAPWKFVSRAAFGVARGLGVVLGLNPWHPEYTPEALREIAQSGGNGLREHGD